MINIFLHGIGKEYMFGISSTSDCIEKSRCFIPLAFKFRVYAERAKNAGGCNEGLFRSPCIEIEAS